MTGREMVQCMIPFQNIRVTDNDMGYIVVTLDGKELRSWIYDSEDERRRKMLLAREYIEGWGDGWEARDGK